MDENTEVREIFFMFRFSRSFPRVTGYRGGREGGDHLQHILSSCIHILHKSDSQEKVDR